VGFCAAHTPPKKKSPAEPGPRIKNGETAVRTKKKCEDAMKKQRPNKNVRRSPHRAQKAKKPEKQHRAGTQASMWPVEVPRGRGGLTFHHAINPVCWTTKELNLANPPPTIRKEKKVIPGGNKSEKGPLAAPYQTPLWDKTREAANPAKMGKNHEGGKKGASNPPMDVHDEARGRAFKPWPVNGWGTGNHSGGKKIGFGGETPGRGVQPWPRSQLGKKMAEQGRRVQLNGHRRDPDVGGK